MRTYSQKNTGEHLGVIKVASAPAIFHAVGSESKADVAAASDLGLLYANKRTSATQLALSAKGHKAD
jgi:hypothetical protein